MKMGIKDMFKGANINVDAKGVFLVAALASAGWNGVDFLFGVVFRTIMY